jgi:hypothetical protein
MKLHTTFISSLLHRMCLLQLFLCRRQVILELVHVKFPRCGSHSLHLLTCLYHSLSSLSSLFHGYQGQCSVHWGVAPPATVRLLETKGRHFSGVHRFWFLTLHHRCACIPAAQQFTPWTRRFCFLGLLLYNRCVMLGCSTGLPLVEWDFITHGRSWV